MTKKEHAALVARKKRLADWDDVALSEAARKLDGVQAQRDELLTKLDDKITEVNKLTGLLDRANGYSNEMCERYERKINGLVQVLARLGLELDHD